MFSFAYAQHSGAESLPLPQKSPSSRPSEHVGLVKKDPSSHPHHHQPQLQPMERRHSSYDSSTSRHVDSGYTVDTSTIFNFIFSSNRVMTQRELNYNGLMYPSRSSSCTSVSRFAAARQSIVNAATKHLSGKSGNGGNGGGNININGLPDPIRGGGGGGVGGPTAPGGGSIYSSHENLRTMRWVTLYQINPHFSKEPSPTCS